MSSFFLFSSHDNHTPWIPKVVIVCPHPGHAFSLNQALHGVGTVDRTVWVESQISVNELRAEAPDLVIVEETVTAFSGDSLVCAIREHDAFDGIPVMVWTAEAASPDAGRWLRRGADDVACGTNELWLGRVLARLRDRCRLLQRVGRFEQGPQGDQNRPSVTMV